MQESSLNSLAPGERGTVKRIDKGHGGLRQRLLEMGFISGTAIEMVRFAPLGDPIEVRVCGYRLSLRRSEAEAVIVQRD